jgi:hypothetical protein
LDTSIALGQASAQPATSAAAAYQTPKRHAAAPSAGTADADECGQRGHRDGRAKREENEGEDCEPAVRNGCDDQDRDAAAAGEAVHETDAECLRGCAYGMRMTM